MAIHDRLIHRVAGYFGVKLHHHVIRVSLHFSNEVNLEGKREKGGCTLFQMVHGLVEFVYLAWPANHQSFFDDLAALN